MTQSYTPVEWTDETPTEPGTLINKARLDQMQTAHHYADGFEEVDTAPSADPGVAYHKVVYCTADSTFYRWTGTEWQKDIDDDTKALLLAHEADHSNPHVVTKAQVGLGNADNTSDLDKPISTATQTALDGKVDTTGDQTIEGNITLQSNGVTALKIKSTAAGPGTLGAIIFQDNDGPKGKIISDKDGSIEIFSLINKVTINQRAYDASNTDDVVTIGTLATPLTDGSVTKVGTGNVGTDKKPIKLVAGVPTPVTNTLIDDATPQVITTTKIFSRDASTTASGTNPEGSVEKLGNITVNSTTANRWFFLGGAARDSTDKLLAGIKMRYNANGNVHFALATTGSNGNETAVEIAQYNRTTDTWDSAMVQDALDAYAPMVRTTGAQTIAGSKTFMADANNTFLLKGETALGAEMNIGSAATGSDPLGMIIFTKLPTLAAVATIESDAAGLLTLTGSEAVTVHSQRAYNTSNTEDVVTIGTLKASTDVVHTSGPETIDGNKTFSGNIIKTATSGGLVIQSTDQTQTSPPSANRFLTLAISGSNNTDLGTYGLACRSNGNREAYIQAFNADGTAETLRMYALANGAGYITGPARAYNASNTTDIVNISLLDGYTPMLRSTGNQTFSGIKKAGGSGFYRKQSSTLDLTTPPAGTITDENYVMEDKNGATAVQLFNSYTANSQTIFQIATKYPFTEGGVTKITNAMVWLTAYADKAVLFLRFVDKNGDAHLKTLGTVTEND